MTHGVETCGSVIICEIIVHFSATVQNKCVSQSKLIDCILTIKLKECNRCLNANKILFCISVCTRVVHKIL